MRTGGIGFMAQTSYNSSFNSRGGGVSSDASAAFLSRKERTSNANAQERSRLVRDLDRRSSGVSVHSVDTSGLSAEEAHKRLLNIKKQQNSFKSTAADKSEGFLKLTQAKPKNELEEAVKKHFQYNYRDISSQIRQAKTSSSAGQAVIKAKRKVLELRRKVAGSTDKDEREQIAAALNHARSMERAAKKKKRHLETEELVENTMKQDEKMSKLTGEDRPEGSGAVSSAMSSVVSQAEDVVEDAYNEIDDMEEQALTDHYGGDDTGGLLPEAMEELPLDDQSLDDLMEDFDDAYDMLDEVMEDLELLEAVDPHMDEEGLKELKIKHRGSEEKDMTKADCEYLKAVFEKYQQDYFGFPNINVMV